MFTTAFVTMSCYDINGSGKLCIYAMPSSDFHKLGKVIWSPN